ncbi:uracil-DNA glycosylase family protein [Pseudoroseomonas globiformis]|uniref:Uracil-DNA glycosylase family protein n=1 Tax=Teichococcus globiformis TaxID=2307229 RepID=A0ABV7FVI3_9PROT
MAERTELRAHAGALSDPAERMERQALLLRTAHAAPILALAARISDAVGRPVPGPDPLDGGVGARLLLLLETPGPGMRAVDIVSRDRPGGTAANLRRFLGAAGIARQDTLIWNVVPWVIHAEGALNRPPRQAELRSGLQYLPPLLDLLPALRVVVLAGRFAAAADAPLRAVRPTLSVLAMPHPSPTFVCTSPAVPARIMAALNAAAEMLSSCSV